MLVAASSDGLWRVCIEVGGRRHFLQGVRGGRWWSVGLVCGVGWGWSVLWWVDRVHWVASLYGLLVE